MPITPYSQPAQSTSVNTYVPLPLQAIHAAVQDRKQYQEQFVELQDTYQRAMDTIARRPEDEEYYRSKVGEYDERLAGLASNLDTHYTQRPAQLRAMARQADRELQPLAARKAAVEKQTEILVKAGWSGPLLTAALNRFNSALPELTPENIQSGRYTANPYQYAEFVDLSTEAARIAKDIEDMDRTQMAAYLTERGIDPNQFDTLSNAGNFRMRRGRLEGGVPQQIVEAVVNAGLRQGKAGNYLNDYASILAEQQGITEDQARDQIIKPLVDIQVASQARINEGESYEDNFAAKENYSDRLRRARDKEEETDQNPFRRRNVPGRAIFGSSIRDVARNINGKKEDLESGTEERFRSYMGLLVDEYNQQHPNNKIDDKDRWINNYINNDGRITSSVPGAFGGSYNKNVAGSKVNVQAEAIEQMAQRGLGVERDGVSLEPEATQDFFARIGVNDIEAVYDQEGNQITDPNLIGAIKANAAGGTIAPPSVYGGTEVYVNVDDKFKSENAGLRNTSGTYRIELGSERTNELIYDALDNDEARNITLRSNDIYSPYTTRWTENPNIPGIERRISGIDNIVARVSGSTRGSDGSNSSPEITYGDMEYIARQDDNPELRASFAQQIAQDTGIDPRYVYGYLQGNLVPEAEKAVREAINKLAGETYNFTDDLEISTFSNSLQRVRGQ